MDKNELMLARDKNKSTMIEYEKPKIDGHLKFEEFNVGPKQEKKIIKPIEKEKTISSESPIEDPQDEESQLEMEEQSVKSDNSDLDYKHKNKEESLDH